MVLTLGLVELGREHQLEWQEGQHPELNLRRPIRNLADIQPR